MLKRDLSNEVHTKLGSYLKKDIEQSVDLIFETVTAALAEGRRVEIRGFGSFSVRSRKGRQAKNPKTGSIMEIPKRKTIHFTMSKSLKDALVKRGQKEPDKGK